MGTVSEAIATILREFRRLFDAEPSLIASAPGRLDFLNTHQDYKGLPVVSVAISKRTYVAVSKAELESQVVSLNLCEEGSECTDFFSTDDVLLERRDWFGNYIRAVVISFREIGLRIGNFKMLIYSEVPVGAGLASSAALQVAAITSLSELFSAELSRQEIAELAYHSEHNVMGVPCGRLDQYGSVTGGITLIETKPPFKTKTFTGIPLEFVVLDSGIRHSTKNIHSARVRELTEGIRDLLKSPKLSNSVKTLLRDDVYETDWSSIKLEDLAPSLEDVNPTSRKRIIFTLKMHESTMLAMRLIEEGWTENLGTLIGESLSKECPDCLKASFRSSNKLLKLLGGIINYQHVLLRDLYDVSTPELEIIRKKALEAGALGVKISGAGMGGSLLALVENRGEGLKILQHISSDAERGWLVSVDEGARIDYKKSVETFNSCASLS